MACRLHQTRFRAQMVESAVDIPGESAVEGRPAHAERNNPGFMADSACCISSHQKTYRKPGNLDQERSLWEERLELSSLEKFDVH